MSTDKHMGTRRAQKRKQADWHAIHENGTNRYVSLMATALRDEAGQVHAVAATERLLDGGPDDR
jgi:hypothetical protein